MSESTLKRCPFCGSLATYVWDDVNETWTAGCTNADCIACANTTMMYGWPKDGSTIEEAGDMWNTRACEGTRWHELFGTPERAARTLADLQTCSMGFDLECDECAVYSLCQSGARNDRDVLLEWLGGDAE